MHRDGRRTRHHGGSQSRRVRCRRPVDRLQRHPADGAGAECISTPDLTFRFHYFAMRKMHFAMRANALVVFPGGMGTMDELFEILALRQTDKAPPIPIVLYDKNQYWREVINFDAMVKHGVISQPGTSRCSPMLKRPSRHGSNASRGGVLTKWLQEQHTTCVVLATRLRRTQELVGLRQQVRAGSAATARFRSHPSARLCLQPGIAAR